ncbi:MAG: amidohydrolase family protein [Candidatus Binatia bacterium]
MASPWIIDLHTCFGKMPGTARRVSPEALLQEMDHHGIAHALTYSLKGVYYEATAGNRETLAAVEGRDELVAVGILDPRRHFDIDREARFCMEQGCALFAFFPHVQIGWSYNSLAFRRCLKEMLPLGIPLMVAVQDWVEVGEVARLTYEYEILTILSGIHYSQMAEGIAAMLAFPHLYLETQRLATPDAVKICVEEVGAERLLFGSGAPLRPVQSALNAVALADITESEKFLILGGNCKRLLGAKHFGRGHGQGRASQAGLGGRLYEGPIIDVHAHIGSEPFPIRSRSVSDLLARCRKHGITKAIVYSTLAIKYDMEAGNRQLVEAIQDHPGVLGYVVLDPNDIDGSRAELDRYESNPQMVGVKINCEYSRKPTGSQEIAQLVSEVAKRNKPLLIHNDGPDWPTHLAALARSHPRLPIIIAHGFFAPYGIREVCEAIKECSNVYLEFASTAPDAGAMAEALSCVGAGRLLLGTDQSLIDPAYVLGTYRDADLNPEETRLVTYENARAIFHMDSIPGILKSARSL